MWAYRALLFALLLVAVTRAQPARQCANCGLGRGTSPCVHDDAGLIRAAKLPKIQAYASPREVNEIAKRRREEQLSQPGYGGPGGLGGGPGSGPYGGSSGGYPGGSGGGYGPDDYDVISSQPGALGKSCRHGYQTVTPGQLAADAAAKAAAAAVKAAARAQRVEAAKKAQQEKNFKKLLGLKPGTPIAPKFRPVHDDACTQPGPGLFGAGLANIAKLGNIADSGPIVESSGPDGPQMMVTGVLPAKPPKAACGCGLGAGQGVGAGPGVGIGPAQAEQLEFERRVAQATAEAVAKHQAALEAAKSPLGFIVKGPGSGPGVGIGGGPGPTGGSSGPGFTPLSDMFTQPNDFDTEDQGWSIKEQEEFINGLAPQSQRIADQVSIDVVNQALMKLRTPKAQKPKRIAINEDKLSFGPLVIPKDGRVIVTKPDVPEEKLLNVEKPILELRLPELLGQGPGGSGPGGSGPGGVGPGGPGDFSGEDGPDGLGPDVGPGLSNALPTFEELGFKAPSESCAVFVNVKEIPAESRVASFVPVGGTPQNPDLSGPVVASPGASGLNSNEVPCGPMGPPVPGYVPGNVVVTPVGNPNGGGSGPRSGSPDDEDDNGSEYDEQPEDDDSSEPASSSSEEDCSCKKSKKRVSLADRARAASRCQAH